MGILHLLPVAEFPEHLEDASCWCEPELVYLDDETDREIWLHKLIH